MPSRGSFIVIEGLDRSGKSTQAALLHDRLRSSYKEKNAFELLKFPDRTTEIGKLIDSYLRSETEMDDRAIHLLFSANRWEIASRIRKLLEAGTTVLCDRYAFSGIAFSASKVGSIKGDNNTTDTTTYPQPPPPLLSYEWCRAPDISLPAPDLTLFLDINPEKAARERSGYGSERYEKLEMQVRVRGVFERIGAEMGEDRWVRVDAGLSREEVAECIWRAVEPWKDGTERPVGKLWEDLLAE